MDEDAPEPPPQELLGHAHMSTFGVSGWSCQLNLYEEESAPAAPSAMSAKEVAETTIAKTLQNSPSKKNLWVFSISLEAF